MSGPLSPMMLNAYPRPSICHVPDTSGLPSAVRGAGAVRFGLPSAVRGIPGVGCFSHWAPRGALIIRTNSVTIARFIRPPLRMRNPSFRVLGPASHISLRLWFRFDYTGIAVQYVALVLKGGPSCDGLEKPGWRLRVCCSP